MNLADITKVYEGSDADATRALYARLAELAPRGPIAVDLLRVCKASERAKLYAGRRGGRGSPNYRALAYDKKDWAIGELCRSLGAHADDLGIAWGWRLDPKAVNFENVIYVEIPGGGQVSFHTHYRRDGPDYAGDWDGAVGQAARRICRWAEAVLDGRELTNEEHQDGAPTGTEGAAAQGDAREQVRAEGRQETFDL